MAGVRTGVEMGNESVVPGVQPVYYSVMGDGAGNVARALTSHGAGQERRLAAVNADQDLFPVVSAVVSKTGGIMSPDIEAEPVLPTGAEVIAAGLAIQEARDK